MAAPGRGWLPLARGFAAACVAVLLLMLLSDGLETVAGVVNLVVRRQALLRKLDAHVATLPRRVRRAARACHGDTRRLENVVRRLMRGEAVSIAALGGSVTVGSGTHSAPDKRYINRLFQWMNSTFPHQGHRFKNGGRGGASSMYQHQCVRRHVPEDADIVVIEFALNDKNASKPWCGMETPVRRDYEALMRKVLQYPRQPAVIALYWFSTGTRHRFYENSQDDMDVIARYYGIPSVSWRDAAFHLMLAGEPGFLHEDVYYDRGHPNADVGHRYIADLLIDVVRGAAHDVLDDAGPAAAAGSELGEDENIPPLPPPMLRDAAGLDTCLLGLDVNQSAIEHEGWQWFDEVERGQVESGWVSDEPDSKLVLQVNTTTARGRHAPKTAVIGIGYLTDYNGLGKATLHCVGGCKCEPVLLDAVISVNAERREWTFHEVGQHDRCLLEVSVSHDSSSGSHRFKVMSVVVTNQSPAQLGKLQSTADWNIGNIRFSRDGKAVGLLHDVSAVSQDAA